MKRNIVLMTVLLLNKRCLERSRESAEPQPKEKIVELKVVILSRTCFIVEALFVQEDKELKELLASVKAERKKTKKQRKKEKKEKKKLKKLMKHVEDDVNADWRNSDKLLNKSVKVILRVVSCMLQEWIDFFSGGGSLWPECTFQLWEKDHNC